MSPAYSNSTKYFCSIRKLLCTLFLQRNRAIPVKVNPLQSGETVFNICVQSNINKTTILHQRNRAMPLQYQSSASLIERNKFCPRVSTPIIYTHDCTSALHWIKVTGAHYSIIKNHSSGSRSRFKLSNVTRTSHGRY